MNSVQHIVTAQSLIDLGLSHAEAQRVAELANNSMVGSVPTASWRSISQNVLKPEHPFEVHRFLFQTVFRDWPEENGQPPAWSPGFADIECANATGVMRKLGIDSYAEFHTWSVDNRETYWAMVIEQLGIRLRRGYSRVLDSAAGLEEPRWFPGAELNIVESCFSAPLGSPAIICQSENGPLTTVTVGELEVLTNRAANGLVQRGFIPGDAIAIDMTMTTEAVALYLGIVKAGCIAISIADSFAPNEIATRLRLGNAKAIFTQDAIHRGGKSLPLYQKIVEANAPQAIVLCSKSDGAGMPKLRPGDIWWDDFLSDRDDFEAVACQPDSTIGILFSSGTTGDPKAIPWTQTTPIKCAADAYFHQDIHPGDRVAWPTNLGWMMGAWLVFASLINRATIALYEGAPGGRDFGEFVQDAKVTMLGMVPSLVQTWRTTECMKGLNWSAIKVFSSTGEASNAEDMQYCMSLAGYRPIIEYCGGTEIGGAYITGSILKPCAPATFNTFALGLDGIIIDDSGNPSNRGELFLIPPSIGLSTRLLNKNHHEVYFQDTPQVEGTPVLRRHGDRMERLGNGYYRAQGRADDTMNLGGIKVGSAEIERVVNDLPHIVESAAIGIAPAGGGPCRLVIYAVCKGSNQTDRQELINTLQTALKSRLNPLFRVHDVVLIDSLPRTATNKILHRELRDQYNRKHQADS